MIKLEFLKSKIILDSTHWEELTRMIIFMKQKFY